MSNLVGIVRAKRAFARKYRFTRKNYARPGAEEMTAVPFRHANGGYCVRIEDHGRGVWAEYNISAAPQGRITWMRDGRL